MSDRSKIEWTDATWNPVSGCTKISRGCQHCYAERFSERWRGIPGHPFEQGFDLRLWPERLDQPSRWTRPRRIFVNSMSDLFHEAIPGEYVDRVFAAMEAADHHQYQVLTKRSSTLWWFMKARYSDRVCPSHIWLGVSVEDRRVLGRIDNLRATNAVVRFLSLEPLLEDLGELDLAGIDWVIVGGESGPGFRALEADWVRSVRDQCVAQGVPFFFKQWGGPRPKSGGSVLDGRTWKEYPAGRDLQGEP